MGISDWPNHTDRVTARKFAFIYIIWSTLWVVGSDYVMHLVLHGPNVMWRIESYKGITYVLVSGFILFMAIRERDRKHKQDRIQSESMLRSLRQSGLIGIYEWTDDKVTDANSTLLEALGYTREELLSGKLSRAAITPPEFWPADDLADQQVASMGRCALYQKEVLRKDGTRLSVLVGRARVEGAPNRRIGYALDVTELKHLEVKQAQLQQQLAQSEKLNALGQLAGGIAHDFNNLLSIIIGYTSLMESRLGLNSPIREDTSQVLKAAETAKHLIRKLLAFSRKQVLNAELLNLNELVSDLSGMLSRVLDERVKLELHLGPKVGNIEADRSQIEQVILNLVVNARDAMPNGGTITIETFHTNMPSNSLSQLSGECEAMRVSDAGIGMDESVRLRLFEPFFTTKQETGGTGLGLATVYGIVKQSGGHLEVESKLGEGSSFTIYFPRARALKVVGPKVDAAEVSTAGSETILLIEDFAELREMIATMLRSKGYQVLQARDGMEAVNLAASHFAPIDLVVTDVIMPKLNGPEAVRQIRARRAGVKVVYITGYADQNVIGEELSAANSITLEKPIRPDALLSRIRELLDKRETGQHTGD